MSPTIPTGKVAVTLQLTPVDAGNLEAMAYAGYRRLRDDCTPEAQTLARDLLNHILDAIQPLLAARDDQAETQRQGRRGDDVHLRVVPSEATGDHDPKGVDGG